MKFSFVLLFTILLIVSILADPKSSEEKKYKKRLKDLKKILKDRVKLEKKLIKKGKEIADLHSSEELYNVHQVHHHHHGITRPMLPRPGQQKIFYEFDPNGGLIKHVQNHGEYFGHPEIGGSGKPIVGNKINPNYIPIPNLPTGYLNGNLNPTQGNWNPYGINSNGMGTLVWLKPNGQLVHMPPYIVGQLDSNIGAVHQIQNGQAAVEKGSEIKVLEINRKPIVQVGTDKTQQPVSQNTLEVVKIHEILDEENGTKTVIKIHKNTDAEIKNEQK